MREEKLKNLPCGNCHKKIIAEVEGMIKSFKPWRVTEDEYTRGKKNGYREALQKVIENLENYAGN